MFIEDFDTWDMTGYYLYSKLLRSGVSAHIGTGGRARSVDEHVVVAVEDDGPGSQKAGFGLGLRNVAERLTLRFGDGATFEHGPLADGGYRAVLSFPLKQRLPE
jgi:LytS/YehU family sensor histidine kinase